MKPIQLDYNDKTYAFARKWGKLRDLNNLDTCRLRTRVLYGCLLWTLCKVSILACIVSGGVCLGDTLAWLVSGILNGFVEPDILVRITLLLAGIAVGAGLFGLAIAGAVSATEAYRRYKWKKQSGKVEPENTGIAYKLYRSFKDKYCSRIETVYPERKHYDDPDYENDPAY